MLPLATSLGVHLGIIIFAVIAGIFYHKVIAQQVDREQTIIPETTAMDKNQMPGGIEHPGPLADPTRDVAQDKTKDTDDSGFNTNPANKIASNDGGSTSNDDEASQFQGLTSAQGKGHSGSGGAGDAFGSGTGGGTAPFGVPGGGGGLLPKSSFFGTGGNANKIVYLCDESGSMIGVFGALKQQLKTSINSLSVENGQQFNVIFFADSKPEILFSDGMRMATPDNLKAAMEWIDNRVPAGATQPLDAINEALKEKPELLYVLTDGFDQISDFSTVTNAFKAGNANGKIHVNCILLQSEPDQKLEDFLRSIASDPKTGFRKIPKNDM